MEELRKLIDEAWEDRNLLMEKRYESAVKEAVELLDRGKIRVAERVSIGNWKVNEWVKKSILLFFSVSHMKLTEIGPFQYYDKIPVKRDWDKLKVRVAPMATARYGSFIEPGAILMPSYINIGAHVGSGTLVDTWATVGSCAQVGKNVHLSGGVGIGGVLEPPGARPVIIEDGCFIGSRSIVVEGAVVEEGAVLGAGVVITASTRIIDVTGDKPVEYKGRIPSKSVVIPGTRFKDFKAGRYGLPCALIIGKRKESTNKKTSLNEILREFNV